MGVYFLCPGKRQISIELCARPMEERKTTENLKRVLREIFEEWGIDISRITAGVTDGGNNIKNAVKELLGAEKHVSCFAHLLNNIGQRVIGNQGVPPPSEAEPVAVAGGEDDPEAGEDFDEDDEEREGARNPLRALVVKLKKIVRFFKQSEVATSRLLKLQETELGKSPHDCLKLVQEVRTRFNSCYDMIHRYVFLLSNFLPRCDNTI